SSSAPKPREPDTEPGPSIVHKEHVVAPVPLIAYETDSQSTESSSEEIPTVQPKKRKSPKNDLVELMEIVVNATSQLRELQKALHVERMEFDKRMSELKMENAMNLERIRFQHDMELEKLKSALQTQAQ